MTSMARPALPATATSPTSTAFRAIPMPMRIRAASDDYDPGPVPIKPGVRSGSTPLLTFTPNPFRGRMDRRGTSSKRADSERQYRRGPTGVGDGWYSYNLGSWHLISLNIECETQPGGCSTTGAWFAAELAWLKNDLEANHSACTLAYWHQPTFSATNGITQEGIDRSGLLATALQVRSRPGAERTRPPLCPLPPP